MHFIFKIGFQLAVNQSIDICMCLLSCGCQQGMFNLGLCNDQPPKSGGSQGGLGKLERQNLFLAIENGPFIIVENLIKLKHGDCPWLY